MFIYIINKIIARNNHTHYKHIVAVILYLSL